MQPSQPHGLESKHDPKGSARHACETPEKKKNNNANTTPMEINALLVVRKVLDVDDVAREEDPYRRCIVAHHRQCVPGQGARILVQCI